MRKVINSIYFKVMIYFVTLSILGITCLLFSGATLAANGYPAIHDAAYRNDTSFVKGWIRRNKNVDYEFNEPYHFSIHGSSARLLGLTPLMVAAEHRSFETVKLLVEAGADIYRESNYVGGYIVGKSVFDYAVEGGDVRIIRYLWSASDKLKTRNHLKENFHRVYRHACKSNPAFSSMDLLRFFLATFDREFASEALWVISTQQSCTKTIRYILDKGITPGRDALVTAASHGIDAIVSLYLQHGAIVNGYSGNIYTFARANVTPLIAAAGNKHFNTMQLLLNKGADPNLQDSRGRTALIAIISESTCSEFLKNCENQINGIELLIKHGARVDIADHEKKTAMDYIARFRNDPNADIKRKLLEGLTR